MSWWEDNHFPFPFCKKESPIHDTDIELKKTSWKRRVDVNMGYYCGQGGNSIDISYLR